MLAPELRVKLLLSQLTKDGIPSFCFAPIPRKNLRRALRMKDLLNDFDGLLHEEILLTLTSGELRRLADTSRTLWIRTPEEADYTRVLRLLPPRKRPLPRALRLLGQPVDLVEQHKLQEADPDYTED